jgi:hypothetical protein
MHSGNSPTDERRHYVIKIQNERLKTQKYRIYVILLRITHYALRITHYALRITHYALRITHYAVDDRVTELMRWNGLITSMTPEDTL